MGVIIGIVIPAIGIGLFLALLWITAKLEEREARSLYEHGYTKTCPLCGGAVYPLMIRYTGGSTSRRRKIRRERRLIDPGYIKIKLKEGYSFEDFVDRWECGSCDYGYTTERSAENLRE